MADLKNDQPSSNINKHNDPLQLINSLIKNQDGQILTSPTDLENYNQNCDQILKSMAQQLLENGWNNSRIPYPLKSWLAADIIEKMSYQKFKNLINDYFRHFENKSKGNGNSSTEIELNDGENDGNNNEMVDDFNDEKVEDSGEKNGQNSLDILKSILPQLNDNVPTKTQLPDTPNDVAQNELNKSNPFVNFVNKNGDNVKEALKLNSINNNNKPGNFNNPLSMLVNNLTGLPDFSPNLSNLTDLNLNNLSKNATNFQRKTPDQFRNLSNLASVAATTNEQLFQNSLMNLSNNIPRNPLINSPIGSTSSMFSGINLQSRSTMSIPSLSSPSLAKNNNSQVEKSIQKSTTNSPKPNQSKNNEELDKKLLESINPQNVIDHQNDYIVMREQEPSPIPGLPPKTEFIIKCLRCKKYTTRQIERAKAMKNFRNHLQRSCIRDTKCPICFVQITKQKYEKHLYQKHHIKIKEEIHNCIGCGRDFLSQRSLRLHQLQSPQCKIFSTPRIVPPSKKAVSNNEALDNTQTSQVKLDKKNATDIPQINNETFQTTPFKLPELNFNQNSNGNDLLQKILNSTLMKDEHIDQRSNNFNDDTLNELLSKQIANLIGEAGCKNDSNSAGLSNLPILTKSNNNNGDSQNNNLLQENFSMQSILNEKNGQ